MKSVSTSLGILFGFAIFVNVVATPGPTGSTSELGDEFEGCFTTPIIQYTDGNIQEYSTDHGAQFQHPEGCPTTPII